jgi:hypothetical protein
MPNQQYQGTEVNTGSQTPEGVTSPTDMSSGLSGESSSDNS